MKYISLIQIIAFWLCLLSSWQLGAQANVSVTGGGQYLSQSAVGAASNRLATELPNHDVRISYVTSYVNVPDRYFVYDSLGLMPFSQVPNISGGFPEATQAEKEDAINTGIAEALNNAGGGSSTIHIIYATAVSLNANAEEEVLSRKFLHFGPSVDRIDEMKVRQIIPDPELEVLSGAGQNDQYLADYVDELIAALNDPNYVINGTVEYEGNVFFDGDTIFYFHPVDELITTQVGALQKVTLQINPNYPASPIYWTETGPIPSAGPIIESNDPGSATDAYLRLKAAHFNGISELQATYGANTTKIWFYPVNLQLDLSDESVVETHTTSAIDAELTNNGFAWPQHPSLYLQLSLAEPVLNGMAVFETIPFPIGTSPLYTWDWSEEVCGKLRFIASAQRSGPGTMPERVKEIRVKCPFPVDSLIVDHVSSNENAQRTVTLADGDTLYVIRANDDNTRLIKFDLKTDEPLSKFWENHTFVNGQPKKEPYWFSEAHGHGISGMSPTGFIFDDPFPSNWNAFNPLNWADWLPLPGVTGDHFPRNEYDMTVSYFHEVEKIPLVFMTENRYEYEFTPSFITDFFSDGFLKDLQKYADFINNMFTDNPSPPPTADPDDPNPFQYDGFTFEPSSSLTLFLKEETDSRLYSHNREVGLTASGSWGVSIAPTVCPIFCGHIPLLGGYHPYLNASIGWFVTYEHGSSRIFYVEDWTDIQHTLEGGASLDFGAGIELELLPNINVVNLSASIGLALPFEAKIKWLLSDSKIAYEINMGPASIDINVDASVMVFGYAELELVSFSHSAPISDKVFFAGENAVILDY